MPSRVHPYTAADLPRVIALLLECLAGGYVDMELRSIELRVALSSPTFDAARHTLLIEERGALRGFGILWQGRYLGQLVHPNARGRLEDILVEWALSTVNAGTPGALSREDDAVTHESLARRGFAVVEHEFRMARPLDVPLPPPPAVDFALRPLAGAGELEEWLALYADAFGPRESALRRWRAYRADSDYVPALDLVAVDPEGKMAGFCTGSIASAEAARLPYREGRTEPVAVRVDARNRGLGAALVLHALQLLREQGCDRATLTTEADNAAAHRFYARLGYVRLPDALWWTRTGDQSP